MNAIEWQIDVCLLTGRVAGMVRNWVEFVIGQLKATGEDLQFW